MSIVFIHIPKTAGNSIRNALQKTGIEYRDLGHSNLKNQGLSCENNFSFCFVRNPYSRIRSAFYHLVEVDIESSLNSNNSFEQLRAKLRLKYGFNFEKFIEDRGFEKFDFSHFYPQTHWIYEGSKRVVNFIGYVEEIDYDFDLLTSILGFEVPPLEKLKITTAPAYTEQFKLSKKCEAIIKEYYKEDFLKLGYDYDTSKLKPNKKSTIIKKFSALSKSLSSNLTSNINNLENGSQFLYAEKEGSDDLIIILSTHNELNKFFALEKLTKNQVHNLLFITNKNNNYYSDLTKNGENFYINFFLGFLKTKSFSNITVFGSSMAGYAAFYMSNILRINAFITNPQINLEVTYKNAWPDLKNTIDRLEREGTFENQIENCDLSCANSYIYYHHGAAKIDIANVNYLNESSYNKSNIIFRSIDDPEHNFPYPDNVEIIPIVHEYLARLKNNRL